LLPERFGKPSPKAPAARKDALKMIGLAKIEGLVL